MFSENEVDKLKKLLKDYLDKTSGHLNSKHDKEFLEEANSDAKHIESLIHELEIRNSSVENDDELVELVIRLQELWQRVRIALCSENLKAKNPKISQEAVIGLCETVNGILKTPDKRDIPEKFDLFLHQWFNDFSLLEEIFKTINSKDLCFLHEVYYIPERNNFYLYRHVGRVNKGLEPIDFEKYYNNQIRECASNLMALNLNYSWRVGPGHATMVVIEKCKKRNDRKTLIKVEHFDSSNIQGELIKEPLENFIKKLFGEDEFDFEFYHQDEVCNFNIQKYLRKSNFKGSCTQFSLWYGLKRLLEPYRTRDEVIDEMNNLLKNNDPEKVMIILIKQFQRVLDIKTEDNGDFKMEVNGRKASSLSYTQMITQFEEKLKKFNYALDRLLTSQSEKDWEDVNDTEQEIYSLREKIIKEHGKFNKSDKSLEDDGNSIYSFKLMNDAYKSHDGYREFRKLLENCEDAINECKVTDSVEVCRMANDLLNDCYDFAFYIKNSHLIENKTAADLVTKYDRLVKEHSRIKNPITVFTPPTVGNIERKNGGTRTSRKKRRLCKQKCAKKKSLKKSRH
jgi:hypothetical protein